ncbi:YlaH-like family protein [Ammoniphilus resinae]|nr:YlaH-like family protein [Ammoniphilus resinae]
MDTYPFYFILVLAIILYELGFSRKLPILKKLATYVLLAIGCIPLTILKVLGLPIIGAMIVAAVILFLARLRRPMNLRDEPSSHE